MDANVDVRRLPSEAPGTQRDLVILTGVAGVVIGAVLMLAAVWFGPVQVRDQAFDQISASYVRVAAELTACEAKAEK